jgi:polysaccharide deacetylase 2 family uncharacterized protein YibQ
MKSFRPLLNFWIFVLALLGGSGALLQYLGPPDHGLAAKRPHAAVITPPPAPAAVPEPAAIIAEPDPSLQEPAVELPDRMLPRIGDSGRAPAQAYAAAFDTSDKHPRIALVIDGLGLDRAMSQQVLRTLPRAIDIAFSAYAPPPVLDSLAREARHQGRECLVSIPMEPSGFPVIEEGDKALLTGNSPAQNRLSLDWVLSNVQGCVGATSASDGMQGERFAESMQSFTDLLSTLDHRGLLYLDARPGAPRPDVAPGRTLPLDVDVVVDRAASPEEPAGADTIDRNLATLERLAAEHGSAIGLAGPPQPVLLERLLVWANGLAARRLTLSPLSAIPPPRALAQEATP